MLPFIQAAQAAAGLAKWKFYLAIVIILVLIFVSGFGFGFGQGTTHEAKSAAEELAKVNKEHGDREAERLKTIRALENRITEREREHAKQIEQLHVAYAIKQEHEKSADAAVIDDLRNGIRRMRIKTERCRPTVDNPNGNTGTAASGLAGAGSAELSTEDSANLWGIGADGDRIVRKLTALQEWAEEAERVCRNNTVILERE